MQLDILNSNILKNKFMEEFSASCETNFFVLCDGYIIGFIDEKESGQLVFDIPIEDELYFRGRSFKDEIYSNIRHYSKGDRNFYLATIKKRLEQINCDLTEIKNNAMITEDTVNSNTMKGRLFMANLTLYNGREELLNIVNSLIQENSSTPDNNARKNTLKLFEDYFKQPQYITTFFDALKNNNRLTDDKCLIFFEPKNEKIEISSLIEALFCKGYIYKMDTDSHRRFFLTKLTGKTTTVNDNIRKSATSDKLISNYKQLLPDLIK